MTTFTFILLLGYFIHEYPLDHHLLLLAALSLPSLGYSDEEDDLYAEWAPWRDTARYYGHTNGHGGHWAAEASPARSPWRPAHFQPDLLHLPARPVLSFSPSPHRRSATDPNISGSLRPALPPRRRLPPTPQQPSNLNIDQLQPVLLSRSTSELPINFPRLSLSPSRKSSPSAGVATAAAAFVQLPPGMIPSVLPRPPVPARRTLPAPLPGWASLEEAVAAGRGSRQLPVVVQPGRPGVGFSPSRRGLAQVRRDVEEEEEEDWC
jgi:hypothetical protein